MIVTVGYLLLQVYASYRLRRDLVDCAKPDLETLAKARPLTLQEAEQLASCSAVAADNCRIGSLTGKDGSKDGRMSATSSTGGHHQAAWPSTVFKGPPEYTSRTTWTGATGTTSSSTTAGGKAEDQGGAKSSAGKAGTGTRTSSTGSKGDVGTSRGSRTADTHASSSSSTSSSSTSTHIGSSPDSTSTSTSSTGRRSTRSNPSSSTSGSSSTKKALSSMPCDPCIPLDPPDMRQSVAWQLCYRALKHQQIVECIQVLKADLQAVEVKDLQVSCSAVVLVQHEIALAATLCLIKWLVCGTKHTGPTN